MRSLFSQPPSRSRPKKLRDYQQRAVDAVLANLHRRPVLVIPTGGGKTFVASAIAAGLACPTLWLAHRTELIQQAAASLRANGLGVGMIKAGIEPEPTAPVQVASIQSLARRAKPDADLIFIDEAHHATAGSYRAILEAYPHAAVIGLTATPFRLDGKGLGDLFGELAVAAYTDELVRDGWLHAPRVYAAAPPDLRGVPVRDGEYSLAQAVTRLCPIAEIVRTWQERANGLQTVAFAVDVKDSRELAQAFRGAGVKAEHLDGDTPAEERAAILAKLARREIQIVVNCLVLTEGWDLPSLECAILRRPTASLNLHLQMIGRVMRSAHGKQGAIVLDHAGNHHVHGLVTRRLSYSLDGSVKVGASEPLGLRQCRSCFVLYDNTLPACPECGTVPTPVERSMGSKSDPGSQIEMQEFCEDFEYRQRIWHLIEAERESNDYRPGWSMFRYEDRFGSRPVFIIAEDGRRELIDPEHASMKEKEAYYAGLLEIVAGKGLNPGWASHRYKEIFGVWPKGFVGKSKRSEIADRWAARMAGGAR